MWNDLAQPTKFDFAVRRLQNDLRRYACALRNQFSQACNTTSIFSGYALNSAELHILAYSFFLSILQEITSCCCTSILCFFLLLFIIIVVTKLAFSLISTIKLKRSDLLPHLESKAAPISVELPPHVLAKFTVGMLQLFCSHFVYFLLLIIVSIDIPGFGVPMLAMYAPQMQSFDPMNWFVWFHTNPLPQYLLLSPG